METNWAAEHLQVIRTLMERSALYRRALAPVMLVSGVLGTGAAVVQQGTTRAQRVVCGTLATLPLSAVTAGLKPPTLIIVGEVVRLQAQLAWYEEAR